jgi:hypothetical protein
MGGSCFILSEPPWGRTSCSTIFCPSLGNCKNQTYLTSLFVYYIFYPTFFIGGILWNNLQYPEKFLPMKTFTGGLSVVTGEADTKRTHSKGKGNVLPRTGHEGPEGE